MKKRLSTDPIDIELKFSVGDRVEIHFDSSTYSNFEVGTVIGIEIAHNMTWKRMLEVKGEVKENTTIIYTVLTDDGDLMNSGEWTFNLVKLEEE